MYEAFQEQGVDISTEPMKVAPTAHYAMGGIKVDFENMATNVEGLYAVGEATSGVHGANRLGGNSLAETIVFGKILGEHLAENLADEPYSSVDEEAVKKYIAQIDELANSEGEHDPQDLISELRDLVWEHGGIIRSRDNIQEGLRGL